MTRPFLFVVISLFLVLSLPVFQAPAVAGYVPHPGDHFSYYEVENLGNGTGAYAGYSEHTVVNGVEQMDGIVGGIVSANYNYSYDWSSSSGSTQTETQSGDYTWSSSTFLYVNGTDDRTGYVNPTVWFAMNPSTPTGGTFYDLNTQMTVISTNYSYYLPSLNRNVTTIFAQGSSSYLRDDSYGVFPATYTWSSYFDPSTGYIVGYSYVEHDSNSSGTGFSYTDDLYVTSTSYSLTTVGAIGTTSTTASSIASSTSTASASNNSTQYLGYLAAAVIVIVIVAILIYALSRRGRRALPEHSQGEPASSGPPPQPPEGIDLTPAQQPPVQQIVIKEVAKKTCKYCGALMDTTAQVCPRCGAPNT